MSEREDDRILALLYDEDSEASKEAPLSDEAEAELAAFRGVLASVRALPDEDPSPHLDALILARAREEAEKAADRHQPWWRRLLSSRGLSLAFAATATVFVAVLVVPTLKDEAPDSQSIPASPPEAVAPTASPVTASPKAKLEVAAAPSVAEAPAESVAKELEKNQLREQEPGNERARSPARRLASAPKGRASEPVATKPAPARFDEGGEAGKADSLGARGPSTVGTIGGSGGVASGAAGGDKDREHRDGVAELDDVVSRAKAKKTAESKDEAKVGLMAGEDRPEEEDSEPSERSTAPAVTMAAPAAPRDEPVAAAEPAPDPRAAEAPAKRSAPRQETAKDGGGATSIAGIRAEARRMEIAGQVDAARRYLLTTRRQYVGKPMYEQVSYELAELELRQRRYAVAEAYARDVLTTKDPALAERAQNLIRVARSAAR